MKPRWSEPPRRIGPLDGLSAEARRLRARVGESLRLATMLIVLLATRTI